jgi:acyl carrier protein phosphodiesterase
MNYLAHIYLSGEDEDLKIGNFIADSVKGKQFVSFPSKIQKGIILHRAIDTFTDSHPIVKKSVHRLFGTYSHYSTVIVDILYDHFLAANWACYSPVPLPKYVAEFYNLLNRNYERLPAKVQQFLPFMISDNWLLNYATVEGIGKILFQMNQRTGNKSRMNLAVQELELYYTEFGEEFKFFFKDLEYFSVKKIKTL